MGEGVEGPAPGTAVVSGFGLACGECRQCARGRDDLCEPYWQLNRARGLMFDGTTRLFRPDGEPVYMNVMSGLAEYSVIPASSVFALPEGLPVADAAILGCAGFTAYGAVTRAADVQPGERVAIVGVGGVGSSCVQIARARGAGQVIAVDVGAAKCEAALALGATHAIDAAAEDVRVRVAAITGGDGVDVAIEALGKVETLQLAIDVLALGGRAVAVGVSPAGTRADLEVNQLVRRQLRLIGSYGARLREDMPQLLGMVARGEITPFDSISRRVTLDDVPETFRALDRREVIGRAIAVFSR